MTDNGLNVEAWESITAAVAHARMQMERALGEGRPNLPALHDNLGQRLATLERSLKVDETEKLRTLLPIYLLIDDLVLRRLGDDSIERSLNWPLLQRSRFGFDDGGDRFYTEAGKAIERQPESRLELEAYYYCLVEGFQGRAAEEDEKDTRLKERLWKKLCPEIEEKKIAAVDASRRLWADRALVLVGIVALWNGLWWTLERL